MATLMRIRIVVLTVLSLAVVVPSLTAADLGFSRKSDQYYQLSGEPIRFAVHIAAFETSEKELVREDWVDHLELAVTIRGSGNAQELDMVNGRMLSVERKGPLSAEKAGIPQWLWLSRGEVEIASLPPGDYEFNLRYRTATARFGMTVWKGDENPEVEAFVLFGKALRAQSWEEYREIQLRRAELVPTDYSVLLDLAKRAERSTTLEETDRYYVRALDVLASNLEVCQQKSQVDLYQGIAVETARIQAIRSLLPELYERRDDREIKSEIEQGRVNVRLVDRSGKVLHTIQKDIQ